MQASRSRRGMEGEMEMASKRAFFENPIAQLGFRLVCCLITLFIDGAWIVDGMV